jgi:hypothetical protein
MNADKNMIITDEKLLYQSGFIQILSAFIGGKNRFFENKLW